VNTTTTKGMIVGSSQGFISWPGSAAYQKAIE
jgi:hypothetical protein